MYKRCLVLLANTNVNLKQILKDWMLLIAMASGVAAYLIYHRDEKDDANNA